MKDFRRPKDAVIAVDLVAIENIEEAANDDDV